MDFAAAMHRNTDAEVEDKADARRQRPPRGLGEILIYRFLCRSLLFLVLRLLLGREFPFWADAEMSGKC